jgi:hypothetical protein
MRKSIAWWFIVPLIACGGRPVLAQGSCESNLKVRGDPRNGAAYVTFVTIPNLDIHSALGQIEKIALDNNLTPGAENYEGDVGTLTVVRKDKSSLLHQDKGFPILIKADKANSRLIMALQLNHTSIVISKRNRRASGMALRGFMLAATAQPPSRRAPTPYSAFAIRQHPLRTAVADDVRQQNVH